MQRFIIALAVCSLVSCSVQEPKEQEVKNIVNRWYEQQQRSDGGGGHEVTGITVLSIQRDPDNKKHFNTVSLATGILHSPPLAIPVPDEPFADTIRMKIEWNGAKWTTVE